MSDAPVAENGGPFEEQRRIYDLLSQETRHLILQYVLGHPAHLPSLDELAYMMPKNKAAVRDQLRVLADAGIVDRYEHPPNENARDLPSQFYGLTERGVDVLYEYNYLRGLPVARAIYDNTRLSEKARRHRDAPRPDLPAAVGRALTVDGADDSRNLDRLARYVREHEDDTRSADAQIEVAKAIHDAGVGPDHDGVERAELFDRLDVEIDLGPRTVLERLAEIGLLERTTPPDPGVFAISDRERRDGRPTAAAEESLEALVAHLDDELQSIELDGDAAELENRQGAASTPSVALVDGAGRTIRSILGDAFDVSPERVADYLRSGDAIDRLDAAVDAIEAAEEVRKSAEYGRIVSVRPACRYRLTERAVDLL